MNGASNGGKKPVARDRRWLVVGRRPGAVAYFLGPFSFERALAEAQWTKLERPGAAVAVYELDKAVA